MQRIDRLDDRRPLIADVSRRGMLHAGLCDSTRRPRVRPDDLPQPAQLDFFADVKLDQDKDGAMNRGFCLRCRLAT